MLSNQAKIESLIFVSGNEGITITELSHLSGLLKPAVKDQIAQLQHKYKNDSSCSFELLQAGESVKMVTKKQFASLIKNYFEAPATTTLSQAAVETLSIIAYKQPITRVDIEEIRGVKASSMIQKLLALELIKEDGRLNVPGRPILYSTTDEFLDYFELHSLDDLPPLPDEKNDDSEDNEQDLMELFEKTIEQED
ncbi:SMC-Scp complex subunit ScpB [Ligilactobacillus sp. LYQ135]